MRVFSVPLEFGDYEEAEGGDRFRVPFQRIHFNGLLELHARDVFQLFRPAKLAIADFRTPRAGKTTLVRRFCDKVRADAVLGPIFAARIWCAIP